MADPTTTNTAASVVNAALKAAIEGASEAEVEALILAETAGIVVIPVIGVIWTAIVNWVVQNAGEYFYTQAALAMTKIIIDFQINGEESAANVGFSNLQMAIASGDPDAIKRASDDLDVAYSALIHFDGSASP